jgi:hypothetical protein
MRIFGRFLYAMLAVGVFLAALTYSISLMRQAYIDDVFGGSLVDESSELPEFYYFYSSLPDYHKTEPIVSINQSGFKLRVYEIARTEFEDEELVVNEYFFALVYNENIDELFDVEYLRISNGTVADQIDISLIQYQELDVLVSVDQATTMYLIEKDTLDLSKQYDEVFLMSANNDVLIESAFTINDSDFIIKENLESFYDEFDRLPEADDFPINDSDVSIQDQDVVNNFKVVDDYLHILGIVMGIYFVLLIFSTYFIFFRKKKKQPIV